MRSHLLSRLRSRLGVLLMLLLSTTPTGLNAPPANPADVAVMPQRSHDDSDSASGGAANRDTTRGEDRWHPGLAFRSPLDEGSGPLFHDDSTPNPADLFGGAYRLTEVDPESGTEKTPPGRRRLAWLAPDDLAAGFGSRSNLAGGMPFGAGSYGGPTGLTNPTFNGIPPTPPGYAVPLSGFPPSIPMPFSGSHGHTPLPNHHQPASEAPGNNSDDSNAFSGSNGSGGSGGSDSSHGSDKPGDSTNSDNTGTPSPKPPGDQNGPPDPNQPGGQHDQGDGADNPPNNPGSPPGTITPPGGDVIPPGDGTLLPLPGDKSNGPTGQPNGPAPAPVPEPSPSALIFASLLSFGLVIRHTKRRRP